MKILDVIFINPPNHADFPHYPIGLGYLNKILTAENLYSRIIDIQNMIINDEYILDRDFFLHMERLFKNNRAKVYAFSIMNSSYIWTIELTKIIKKIHPDSKIIIGGAHATLLKDRILREVQEVDVVAIYEGEKIIADLVKALLNNNNSALFKIKNIIYRNSDNEILYNEEEELLENLDLLPTLDYSLSEYKNRTSLSLDVGRGCPYNCYFCVTNTIWKKSPRYKSAERIVEESSFYYEKIKQNKNAFVYYEHDNFLANKNMVAEIIKKKEFMRLDFAFGCSARADSLDEYTIELLEKASCKYIFLGIESGSDKIQRISKKNLCLPSILPTIKKLTDKNIAVETNFIIGFPEETFEDLMETYILMAEIKWTNPQKTVLNFSLLTAEPSSEVKDRIDNTQYIIDTTSVYYNDFSKVGIDPTNYNVLSNSHLYLISNKHYDIVEMGKFTYFYKELLLNFPVTMYIIFKLYNYSIRKIYAQFMDSIQRKNILEQSLYSSYLIDIISKLEFADLYYEVFIFENLRAKVIKKMITEEVKLEFKYPIQSIYNELKTKPEVILERNYEKAKTIIKFR